MRPGVGPYDASPECTLAARPGYQDLHIHCRQTRDLPLPFAVGILLQSRCGCSCHPYNSRGGTPTPPAR
jgi:hypothetical protein